MLISSNNSVLRESKVNSLFSLLSKSPSSKVKNLKMERLSFFSGMNSLNFRRESLTSFGTLKLILSSPLQQRISFFFSSSSHSLRYFIILILLHFMESAISLIKIGLPPLRSIRWENNTACIGFISSFFVT